MPNSEELLEEFWRIFYADRSKYVIHKPPFTTDDSGKLRANKVYYALADPGYSKEKKPLTKEDFRNHLNGEYGVAVEPLCSARIDKGEIQHNVCCYAVIDIDVYGDAARFLHLIQSMYRAGLRFSAVVSKSQGIHLYFIWEKPEQAGAAIELLKKIVMIFGLDRLYVGDKNKSKVEIFPMHAQEIPGENGRCVFLPFYNSKGGSPNKMLTVEGELIGIARALPLMRKNFTSVKEMTKVMNNLPYNDAPYCIQMMALTGALGNNSGRNKFLFHSCVYFKRKYGKEGEVYNYLNYLLELDSYMESPLQEEDYYGVVSTYESANSKDWNYSCRYEPMCSYCNKAECKKRTFSGTFKDGIKNENTGADMLGDISRVLARVPYYVWDIAAPGKEATPVRFDSIAEIQSQAMVQQHCWDSLGWAPTPVSPATWVGIVNEHMSGIDDRQIVISAESDTTELSELHSLISDYITYKQVLNGSPYMIHVGQVYHNDGWYYFTTDGVKGFLRTQGYKLGRVNLREELLKFGCEEGEVTYIGRTGVKQVIRCWKKAADEELAKKLMYYDDVYEGDSARAETLDLGREEAGDEKEPDTVF